MVSKIFTFLLACVLDTTLVSASYDSTKPIVKMAKYDKNWRTLSVPECFTAQGKMCILKDGGSMIGNGMQ